MALKTRFVRDAQNRVCGTVTTGYQDNSEIIRNRCGQVIGHVLNNQQISKDTQNRIIAHSADSGFFFGFREE